MIKRYFSIGIFWNVVALICTGWIFCTSCGDRRLERHPRKFIDKGYSESRVIEDIFLKSPQEEILDRMEVDFTKMQKPEGIEFENIECELTSEGLEISCQSSDPKIVFSNREMKYNKVEIELKSSISGSLQIFWAKSNEAFQEKWSKKKEISQSNVFKTYLMDLSLELNTGLNDYQFRIDPIDRKGALTIRAVRFYWVYHNIPSIPNTSDDLAGKVKISHETLEIADKLEMDFTKVQKPSGIEFSEIEYGLTREGLNISCLSDDPSMVFVDGRMKYNKIEIELKSEVSGSLQIFWSKKDEAFQEKWSKKKRIHKSDTFKKYAIDLSRELAPDLNAYQFRIDPIKGKGNLTIKSITFYKVYRSSPSEVREAFVMQAGQSVEKEVEIYEGDVFSFGLAKFKINDADCFFQIFLEQEGEKKVVLFEKELAVNENSIWADYSIDLTKYAGKVCKISLAIQPIEQKKKTALLFCSNPRIQPRGRNREKPNIILISIDTLGARHLSLYDDMRNTGRFLEEMARQGVVFKNAFVNSSVTNVSHGSMLTGMEPLKFDIIFSFDDEWLKGFTTLAEIFRNTGYLTTAYTGGILVTERLGFDKGFESFYEEGTLYKDKDIDIELILEKALAWVSCNHESPFFLFLHSYEPHGRYYKHEDFFGDVIPMSTNISECDAFSFKHMLGEDSLDPSEINKYVKLWKGKSQKVDPRTSLSDIKCIEAIYDSEIAFVDFQLEKFFKTLRKKGLLDNTIVVITSDHGEAFFEHNLLEHGLLYEENLRVPLIFWGPNIISKNVSVEEYVSSIDIVPTILDFTGIETQYSFDGRSLRHLISQEKEKVGHRFYSFVPDNGFSCYIDDRYKYIVRACIEKDNFGEKEFFDLKKDPFEEKNLFDGLEKLPPEMNTFAEDTIKSFPGIHISFEGTGEGVFEMKFVGARKKAYGFEIEKIGIKSSYAEEGSEEFVFTVKLRKKSEMVIFSHPESKKIALSLKPVGLKEEFLYFIPGRGLDSTKMRIKANGTDKELVVWEVKSVIGNVRKRLSSEEEQRLRSLGYIQ